MKISKDAAFAEAVRRFDFNAVAELMKAHNWLWSTGGKAKVPDSKELVATCYDLWFAVRQKDGPSCISTGGFSVGFSDDDYPCAYISFTMEESVEVEGNT